MYTHLGNSYLRLRKGLFVTGWFAALATTWMTGCSQSADPIKGSETHFLEACNTSCGGDLECIDGQCSKRCSNDNACNELNREASCEEQPSGVRACEVGCSEESDCTELRPELSCNAGVCRGPLWQLNVEPDTDAADDSDTSESDASDDTSNETSDAAPPVGSGFPIECGEHPGCPPSDAMYFWLPEAGLGTTRIEFMFDLGEAPFVRCATEFVDDVMVDSSCESDAVGAAVFEDTCNDILGCEFGRLRFDVHPNDFQVTYWQSNGHQTLPLDTMTWTEDTFKVGPDGCNFSCSMTHLTRYLPSTKGLDACLTPQSECSFGLGCGDRASALANAPECDDPNSSVLVGEGCGYDVLIYQQYIESERAFYDPETGELVGFWHRSDTSSVECSGQVPFDCSEVVDVVDVCASSDAGASDSGSPDVGTE